MSAGVLCGDLNTGMRSLVSVTVISDKISFLLFDFIFISNNYKFPLEFMHYSQLATVSAIIIIP